MSNRTKIKYAAAPFTYTVCTYRKSAKYFKKHTHLNFCPASLLIQHCEPAPPPPCFCFVLLFIFFFADENKYSGLDIPENKFSGRAHAENKYFVPTKFASPPPPPPQNQMVAPNLIIRLKVQSMKTNHPYLSCKEQKLDLQNEKF